MIQIIPKAVAKELGMKRFFTGKPCKYGHFSERGVKCGACIECKFISNRAWRENNKERHRANALDWHWRNRERSNAQAKKWYWENKQYSNEGSRQRYIDNREYRLEYVRKYRLLSKGKRRESARLWNRRQYATNPEYRLTRLMRSMLRRTLRSKSGRSADILGYSAADLKVHLERQFTKGMSWQALLDGEIHIDHIYPVAQFIRDGETDPAVINCLTNLRPMWAADNLAKKDRIETLL